MRKINLIFIIILIFVVPGEAFEDDFGDNDLTGWAIVSGSWTESTGKLLENSGASIYYIRHPISAEDDYYSIDLDPIAFAATTNRFCWVGTTDCTVGIAIQPLSAGGLHFSVIKLGSAYPDYVTQTTPTADGGKINLTVMVNSDHTQITINIYNNGALFNTQTVAYTYQTPNNILFGSYANNMYYDNVYTSIVSPTVTDSITFDEDSYGVDDVAIIDWTISNSIWDAIHTQSIEIIDSSNHKVKVWDSVPQTGTLKYQWTGIGDYTVKLFQYTGVGVARIGTLIDSDDARVVDSMAYITGPSTAYVGANVTINYKMAEAFTSGAIQRVIVGSWDPSGTYITLPAGETGVTNISFPTSGKYDVRLWNLDLMKVEDSFQVDVKEFGEVPLNISQNYLVLDSDTYTVNDVVYYNYAVSDANFSAYNLFYITLRTSSGITIKNQLINDQSATGTLSIAPDDPFGFVQTGAATVNLSAKLTMLGAETSLVSLPITIKSGEVNGYSLYVYPSSICKDERLYVTYKSPGTFNLKVSYVKSVGGNTNETIPLTGNGTRIFMWNPIEIMDKSLIMIDMLYQNNGTAILPAQAVVYKKTACTVSGSTGSGDAGGDGGTGGDGSGGRFAADETEDDITYRLKNWVYYNLGTSRSTLFLIGIALIMIVAIIGWVASKHTVGGIMGAFLGLFLGVKADFFELYVAVGIFVFAGLIFMNIMKKG